MKSVTVRGVELGTGLPKIIIPIVSSTRQEILRKAREMGNYPTDLVEWRADYFDALANPKRLLETAKQVRGIMPNTPLLFTIHTREEGGEAELDDEQYGAINRSAAQSGFVDMVDISFSISGAEENLKAAHDAGCVVVGSYHNYDATPSKEEMLERMRRIQEAGADIVKLAVMPHGNGDVLALLSAAVEMHEQYADRPLLAISMGPKGVISRVACETIGSCMTFGAAGQTSAPGQIQVMELKTLLQFMHTVSGG